MIGSRGDPGIAGAILLALLVSAPVLAQPYTTTLVNHSATASITCNVCTLTPSPCAPGQTCSAVGWGFNTFLTGDVSLRWRSLLRDGYTTQANTGTTLYHNLSEVGRVDAYDVIASEYVWLSQNNFQLVEDGGSVRITAMREGALSSEPTNVTIDFCDHVPQYVGDPCLTAATISYPPEPSDDFLQTGGTPTWQSGNYQRTVYTLQIPANQRTASFVLTSRHDTLVEPDEAIYFRILAVDTCGWYEEPTPLYVKINDDDRKVTLEVSNPSVTEGETTTVTARVTPPHPTDGVIVGLVWSGTATYPNDYYTTSTAISVPAGSETGSITIGPYRDCTDEPDEIIHLEMTGASNASEDGEQVQEITIVDGPPGIACPQLASLTIDDPTIAEGASTTVTATLDRTAWQNVVLTLGFSGTANAGDYESPASIAIAEGSKSGTALLTAKQDTIDESDETLTVTVTAAENAVIPSTLSVVATIIDDDARPVVTPGQSFSVAEGSAASTSVGTVVATDADTDATLQGWIIATNVDPDGDGNGAFVIVPATGQLIVNDSGDLDFETNPTLVIQVSVSDGANVSAPEIVTIQLTDVDDQPGPCSGQAAGTICRAPAGPCDAAETCDGVSRDCPPDGFKPASEVCRASAGECDPAEQCTGVSALCPDDAKSTAVCRDSAGICDVAEFCDGVSSVCPADGFKPASEVCRASAGECDPAEQCTGVSALCPDDAKSTAVCRDSAGTCDVAESCDGVSSACPADGFRPASEVCRASAGECDPAEQCTGVSALCPDDAKSKDVCRAASGECDVSESCDGVNDTCPADGFLAAGLTCRSATDICDAEEVCSGSSAKCPDDVFASAAVVCRESTGECDAAERCSGIAASCPPDAFASAGTPCGVTAAKGVCDQPDICNGSGKCTENLRPSSTICRQAAGPCDVGESCTGAAVDCPVDAFASIGTPCGSAVENGCTGADTCDGAGTCDPNNVPCSALTDASLCAFDEGTCGGDAAPVFRLLFTPDVKEWPAYKLTASTPGQFRYNLLEQGAPHTTSTITVEVPYPFITQGAPAVTVYDARLLRMTDAACFIPPAPLTTFDVRIAIDDWTTGPLGPNAGRYDLTCLTTTGPVDSNPATCTFELPVTLPASGEVFVSIRFDYGLEGKSTDANPPDLLPDRYDVSAPAGAHNALQNTTTNTGVVRIRDCEPYEFAHTSPHDSFVAAMRSLNEFKKIAGVFGMVLRSQSGEVIPNMAVRLLQKNTGAVMGAATTDGDGFYLLPYKHKGKPDLFTVKIDRLNLQQDIELNANGWAEVSFDLTTGTAFGEFGTGSKGK